MPNFYTRFPLFLFLLIFPKFLSAQLDPVTVSIPMSDGKMLAGDLYLPNETDAFPTILIQTPYNKNTFLLSGLPLGVDYDIESSDYAFLIVDWRCYFASLPACTGSLSNGEDGYDVVEWIAQQNWSDGKVGTWGPSALGTVQFQTAREQPPHLVCAVPIVVSPQTSYHKFFPGGSLRVDYSSFVGTYFGFQSLITANPYYNLIWTITENGSMYPAEIDIPMLIIGGWYDHNTDDCLSMFDTLRSTSTPTVREQHRILMGPWSHSRVGNSEQGELSFPNSDGYADLRAKAFFDYHLREVNNDWENSPFVEYYQMGENNWATAAQWPPQGLSMQQFYLREDFSLQSEPPAFAEQSFSYLYDPTDPSPSIGGKLFNANLFDDNVGPLDQG
ncbi:MAG: CocE/NonD family hydrolase, partial [Phaeodactylibacter sp.]|nr:CocE/NonD family hydrolase [Phaeodactylibacter sp.]